MTRKDYILLAHALRATQPPPSGGVAYTARLQQWQEDCYSITFALASANHNFDRERFLAATAGDSQ